jgi:hypothetical protein
VCEHVTGIGEESEGVGQNPAHRLGQEGRARENDRKQEPAPAFDTMGKVESRIGTQIIITLC